MIRKEGWGRTRRYYSCTVSWCWVEWRLRRRKDDVYILVDARQLPGWPSGRERPCVLVLSCFIVIFVAEDSARTPQPRFLTVVISSIADG